MVLEALLRSLKDDDQTVRMATADALGEMAEVDSRTKEKAFLLLTHYDSDVRSGMRLHFTNILLQQAEKEQEPGQFLLDHLEGRRLLMGSGDIHVNAAYRDVAIDALARWLTLNKDKAKATRETITHKLEELRDHGNQLHLRISAWKIFVAASKYREQQRAERDKE